MTSQTPERPSFFPDENIRFLIEQAHKWFESLLNYKVDLADVKRTDSSVPSTRYQAHKSGVTDRPKSARPQPKPLPRQTKRLP